MMKPSNPSPPPRPISIPKKSYKLGEDITVILATGYIPEAIPYYSDLKTITIEDNSVTMAFETDEHEKIKIFMTPDQAKAIRKGLKIQIKRLGGNK